MHSPTNETDSILAEAARLVAVDRDADYGDPVVNHERIAALWSAFLKARVSAREVAIMCALMKLSRDANRAKRDNLVDAAAYLEIASRCRREDEERITLIGCREQTYGVTPSEQPINGAAKFDAIDEIRMVLEATLDESTVDAAKRVVKRRDYLETERFVRGEQAKESADRHQAVRDVLGADQNETTIDAARRIMSEHAEQREAWNATTSKLRTILGAKMSETTEGAARRVMAEHAAMSATLRAHETALVGAMTPEMRKRCKESHQRTESVAGGCVEGAGETASNKTPAPPSAEDSSACDTTRRSLIDALDAVSAAWKRDGDKLELLRKQLEDVRVQFGVASVRERERDDRERAIREAFGASSGETVLEIASRLTRENSDMRRDLDAHKLAAMARQIRDQSGAQR